MIIWTIGTSILLVFLFVLQIPQTLWDLYRTYKVTRNIPGMPTHWLRGNLDMVQQDQKTRMKFLKFVQEKKHKFVKILMGPFMPIIWVVHCQPVHKIVKFEKPEDVYTYMRPWLGDGLVTSQQPKNKRHRRMITPAFHHDILKGYVPVINSCLEIFLKKWKGLADSGETVDTYKEIASIALDVISRCAFSNESNCQLSTDNQFLEAIPFLTAELTERIVRGPMYAFDFIYFNSSYGRKFKYYCDVAHNYTESVIRERKKALKIDENGVLNEESEAILKRALESRKNLDFLDILLTAHDEDGKGLTDLEIRHETDNFLYAGYDTTTGGVTATLYLLAKYPEHQDKVREEVKGVLMGREWLEYDDLKDLKYTMCCIKEAMRLFPPVLAFSRLTSEDIEIDGYVIPKDVILMVDISCIHRHPDTWENPNEYDPLRFSPSNCEGRDPYAYVPFSAGNRSCPGQTFATNEEKILVASIIHRFEIALDKVHSGEGMLLPPLKNVQLKLKSV